MAERSLRNVCMMVAVGATLGVSSRWVRTLAVLGLTVAVGGVAACFVEREVCRLGVAAGPFVLVTALCLGSVSWLRALATRDSMEKRRRLDDALLVPCALAPAVVVSPLLAVRRSKGLFLLVPEVWLDALPHASLEDGWFLIGGAQLASCVTPALLALYATRSARPRPIPVSLASAVQVLGYVPALAIHDGRTILTSVAVALAGPYLGVSRQDIGDLPGDLWLALQASAGAWLRLFATLGMVALTARILADGTSHHLRPPPVVHGPARHAREGGRESSRGPDRQQQRRGSPTMRGGPARPAGRVCISSGMSVSPRLHACVS